MADVQALMANLTDEQVAEYQTAKYPASVQSWAKQEQEARVARRQLAQDAITTQIAEEAAREGRKATITKIAKSLEKVWTDDLANVLITREDVDDTAHGEEIEVVKVQGESPVKETRYPKVKALVVRTNIFWTEKRQASPPKSSNGTTTNKRAITVSKRSATNPSQLDLVGHFRSANEACTHLKLATGQDSATRVLQRDGYFAETYEGTDYTVAK